MSSNSESHLHLALTSNDARARLLFEEMKRISDVVSDVNFDQIDPLTRYAAAALSFKWSRLQWWDNYHMHPLIQRRRRKALQRGLGKPPGCDAILMWGSWFHPTLGLKSNIPFFNYIDQSLSLTPLLGEPPSSQWGRRRSHQLQAETYRASSGIFCMSRWAYDQTIASHQVPREKIHVVNWGPCGVDLSQESLGSFPREPVVLHVSNDFRRKGIDFLLRTAAKVRATHPEVRFVVVGRDTSGMEIVPTDGVEFTGQITDREKLAGYFRRASIFFMPHRFDRSPHVAVEAMSAGLPLVASAQGGAIELIEGQGTGYLVPIGDVDGYVESLLTLLRNHDHRTSMGQRALALMRSRYNWGFVAKVINEHIQNSLEGRFPVALS